MAGLVQVVQEPFSTAEPSENDQTLNDALMQVGVCSLHPGSSPSSCPASRPLSLSFNRSILFSNMHASSRRVLAFPLPFPLSSPPSLASPHSPLPHLPAPPAPLSLPSSPLRCPPPERRPFPCPGPHISCRPCSSFLQLMQQETLLPTAEEETLRVKALGKLNGIVRDFIK